MRFQQFIARNAWLAKLSWVLPAIALVLAAEASMHLDFPVPVPFLTVLVAVTLAGAMGGRNSGLFAGITAALFVVHAYLEQFGPFSLTGGLFQTTVGATLYVATGALIGQLRDQRDSNLRSLRDKEQRLESLLTHEIAEGDIKAAKIAESEARLQQAVTIAGVGYFVFDAINEEYDFCSKQHAALHGLTPEEFIAETTARPSEMSLVHPEDRDFMRGKFQELRNGKQFDSEYRTMAASGDSRYVRMIAEPIFDETGKVIQGIGTSFDITELRLTEMRLRRSQRIEAMGALTGGVAHDFNNLLAIILGNLELCLTDDHDFDDTELIKAAAKAARRGADLTKNLLSFSRRAQLEPKRLSVNTLVQNAMDLCARVLPETIDIEHSLLDGLWDVELDAASTENALINIFLNARDAMPDGGKVTIETANMQIGDEHACERNEDIEPGRYVMLTISDTGHGIPAEGIEDVFEPFFTTKPIGQGTGLGLSMVHGFIKQSGGAIRVNSEVGVGTTFKLYFKAAPQGALVRDEETHEQFHLPSEKTEIFVVEDENEVLKVLKRMLENAGYTVTTASSGDEAVEVFKASGRFDLLVTDVVMPGELQGPALASALRLIDPDLPCIFVSGYAAEATAHGNELRASDIRLMKPVSRSELLGAVSQALCSIKHSN